MGKLHLRLLLVEIRLGPWKQAEAQVPHAERKASKIVIYRLLVWRDGVQEFVPVFGARVGCLKAQSSAVEPLHSAQVTDFS